jgi:hypothetical protein
LPAAHFDRNATPQSLTWYTSFSADYAAAQTH